ncbi:DNA cytosine methyltransferase [Agrobacterium rubi]|nr:DNA cytosine methyltransferase [Agrobacterium rubi]NTF24974.1 DNA cytosine methyltransferase [Agrobacterium rubi]
MTFSKSVVSLFSGGMGMDIGLQQAGLDIAVSQDFDRHCVATMRANAAHPVVHGDIKALFGSDPAGRFLLDPAGLEPGQAFAVVGGPPCQSFSNAGKRLGLQDVRGTLFQEFHTAIRVVRPRFFVMENVAAMGSKSMPGVLDMILDLFADIGYTTVHGVLDASDFGTPQKRKRLIIIGSRDAEPLSLPAATHSLSGRMEGKLPKTTVREAIGDLVGNEGPRLKFSQRTLQFIGQIPSGGNWRDLPEDMQRAALGNAFNSGGGKTGFMRRLPWDGQAPTLVTSPVGRMSLLAHPSEDRPLSISEYARIQGFPDEWQFSGPVGSRYRQVGNAVAVPLARAIGRHLLRIAAMKGAQSQAA